MKKKKSNFIVQGSILAMAGILSRIICSILSGIRETDIMQWHMRSIPLC